MNITEKGICRGDGKIFIKVAFSDTTQAMHARLINASKGGVALPAQLYRIADVLTPAGEGLEYAAVIPNLPTTQVLTFSVADASGNEVAVIKKTIGAQRAKWESRLNYRLRKQLVSEIRNYDRAGRRDNIEIEFDQVIPFGEGVKLRMTLTSVLDESDLKVTCLGAGLKPVDITPIHLGSQEKTDGFGNPLGVNEVKLSIDLPSRSEFFLIEARSAKNPSLSGFAVLEPKNLETLLTKWCGTYVSAEYDPVYEKWFDAHRPKGSRLAYQVTKAESLTPSFTFALLPGTDDAHALERTLNSIFRQSYPRWDIMVVGDPAPVQHALSAFPEDSKERVRFPEAPLSDAGAFVLGAIATESSAGYVCLLEPGVQLEPNALFEIAYIAEKQPAIQVFYSDSDEMGEDGDNKRPSFKPDLSLDLLRCSNYIGPFLCIKRLLLEDLEIAEPSLWEWEAALRLTEQNASFHHIQQMLYHALPASTGEPYFLDAERNVLKAHLGRAGLSAEVLDGCYSHAYDIKYAVEGQPLVSIIIPTKDSVPVLKTCIDSVLEKTTYGNYEIVIVENNSTEDETFEYYDILSRDERIAVARWPEGFNFSKLMNFGVSHAKGDYFLFLNNDTEVITPDWLERMVGICQRPDVGVVGVRLWYPDEVLQHTGVTLVRTNGATHLGNGLPKGDLGYFGLAGKTQDLLAVTAACMMTKRSVFDEVDGFEDEFASSYNDVDFCFKVVEAGKLVVYTPYVELYHYESLSRGEDDNVEKRMRLLREDALMRYKWPRYFVEGDPFYNKNFSIFNPGSHRLIVG